MGMEIGLSHPNKTAIRKEDGFSYFPEMLQHPLHHNENKLSEAFKNPRLSCPSNMLNALTKREPISRPALA